MKEVCSSCKTDISNDIGNIKFKCPSCLKQTIIRCKHCREIVSKYKCPECNFEGPN